MHNDESKTVDFNTIKVQGNMDPLAAKVMAMNIVMDRTIKRKVRMEKF